MCRIVFNFEENRTNVSGWFGNLAGILQFRNSFSTLSPEFRDREKEVLCLNKFPLEYFLKLQYLIVVFSDHTYFLQFRQVMFDMWCKIGV